MELESVMVTGANQGIGLEFVKQLVKLPKPPRFVFAADKDESNVHDLKDLQERSKETEIVIIKMDITKVHDIEFAKKIVAGKVGEKGLNLLINNAGVARLEGFPDITEKEFLLHFSTNTVGSVMVLKVMLPLLQKSAETAEAAHKKIGLSVNLGGRAAQVSLGGLGAQVNLGGHAAQVNLGGHDHQKNFGLSVSRAAVINMSSMFGSITRLDDTQPNEFLKLLAYRTSKAALNMSMRAIALTIKDQGILVVNMCPGWVRTDLTHRQGNLEPSESVSAMLHTFQNLNESHHGTVVNRNGKIIPF